MINPEHSHRSSGVVKRGGEDFNRVFYPDSIEDNIPKGSPATAVYLVPKRMSGQSTLGLVLIPEGIMSGQYQRIGHDRQSQL